MEKYNVKLMYRSHGTGKTFINSTRSNPLISSITAAARIVTGGSNRS